MVKIKPTNESKQINGYFANELIKDLFSYLFYSHPTF